MYSLQYGKSTILMMLCILHILQFCLGNARQDSPILVRLFGQTTEVVNKILDNILRVPLMKFDQSNWKSGLSYQNYVAKNENFMCNTTDVRTPIPPTSVHKLRPGDIDVIGALGDSLTAGIGPMATDAPRLLLNNRGLSWAGGGQGEWREFLTLPNILKEFNPNLIGYSTGDGFSYSKRSGFNVAVTGAISLDLPHQARELVRRWRNDQRVNMTEHWKLVTILIGSNDICIFACYEPEKYSGAQHAKHLMDALDYLYKNVPRLFVNLVMQPDLSVLKIMPETTLTCRISHYMECPCIFGGTDEVKRNFADKFVQEYRKEELSLVESGRYDGRDDFTVVLQPFTYSAINDDMRIVNKLDMKLFAIDCFHLSQKGNAYASNAVWNNMLEPIGNKSKTWRQEFEHFLCPTNDFPYLYTRQNSKIVDAYERQD